MTVIEKILADYESGTITKRERVVALARLISPETVEATLAELPPDVLQELLQWARAAPLEGGVVIGGELSGAAAGKMAGDLNIAIRALRLWEAKREGEPKQTVPAPGTTNASAKAVARSVEDGSLPLDSSSEQQIPLPPR